MTENLLCSAGAECSTVVATRGGIINLGGTRFGCFYAFLRDNTDAVYLRADDAVRWLGAALAAHCGARAAAAHQCARVEECCVPNDTAGPSITNVLLQRTLGSSHNDSEPAVREDGGAGKGDGIRAARRHAAAVGADRQRQGAWGCEALPHLAPSFTRQKL